MDTGFFNGFSRKFLSMDRMRVIQSRKPVGVLCLLAIVLSCGSWGFLVHRTVAQLAIYQLPKQMRSFFYMNKLYLVKEAPRPDTRRNTDPTEGSKHFIDLEIYGDSAAWKMPMSEAEAIRIYTKDTLYRYGTLPYVVLRVKQQLTEAFRRGDRDSILYYATDLGHYIGDAHVPLHTAVNYDGQLTGQKGLHNLWESAVPDLEMNRYQLSDGHKARYLADPAAAIWEAVRHANALLPDVFGKEKEVAAAFPDSSKYHIEVRNGRESKNYSREFAKAYAQQLGKTVNEQLLHSASLIADFWYTAWVDGGRPDLNALLAAPLEKKDKKECRKEYKAYKNNRLIEDSLLLSRSRKWD